MKNILWLLFIFMTTDVQSWSSNLKTQLHEEIAGSQQTSLNLIQNHNFIETEQQNISKALQESHFLVMQHNELNRKILVNALEIEGCVNIDQVSSYQETLTAIASKMYNILLIDFGNNIPSGMNTIRDIRKHYSQEQLIIIAVTGYTLKDLGEDFFNAGGNDYIPKPYLKKQILSSINHYFEENTKSSFKP